MNIRSLLIRTCCNINPSTVNRKLLHQIYNADLNLVNETSIKKQLNKFSVPYKEGYTCLRLEGCLCNQESSRPPINGEVFINKKTGFFLCENCKATGEWSSFSNLLTKIKNEKVDVQTYKQYWKRYDKDFSDWKEVVATTESLSKFPESAQEKILRKFNLPHCSRALSEKLKIRVNEDRTLLFFPLQCSESAIVGYKTFDRNGKENTFPKTDCPGFLLHSNFPKSSAVVVSNISDYLCLISQNIFGYDVICLQYGASHLPQSSLPFFEKYHKLILWLGEGTLDATGMFSKKLVEKRCYVIRPTENQVSVSFAVFKKQNIAEILSKAKLTWHHNVTTFSEFRDEILVELQNNYEASGVPWKRFPELTKILKGHRRGELTILTGATGVGKTTFLSEYTLDLAMQGVNTLWGSFELKNTRLAKILLTQFAEGPISTDLREFNSVCDRFEELPFFFLTFHGQQEMKNVMDAIKHCSYTYDISHVIIDNVQFMIEVAPEFSQLDRFWKQDFMIQSFRSFASLYNCHVTLVIHPRKTEGVDLNVNSIFGGAKATQEADNVIIIQKKDYKNFGAKKYLQVCKNRYSGDLGMFRLHFDKASLSFSKPPEFRKFPVEEDDFKGTKKEYWHGSGESYAEEGVSYVEEEEEESYVEEEERA